MSSPGQQRSKKVLVWAFVGIAGRRSAHTRARHGRTKNPSKNRWENHGETLGPMRADTQTHAQPAWRPKRADKGRHRADTAPKLKGGRSFQTSNDAAGHRHLGIAASQDSAYAWRVTMATPKSTSMPISRYRCRQKLSRSEPTVA